MTRIRFQKGKQREFLKDVLSKVNAPSLRELRKRGINVPYSTLKNYFNEGRTIPSDLFERLLVLSGLNRRDFVFEVLGENYGQVKGGKRGKRS